MNRDFGIWALSLGLAGIGAGLALLYLDFRVREGQWVYLTMLSRQGIAPELSDIQIWRQHGNLWLLPALWGLGLPLAVLGAIAVYRSKEIRSS